MSGKRKQDIIRLTSQNFFGMIRKEYPIAYGVFLTQVENFKTKMEWSVLLAPSGVNEKGELQTPTFEDIPYAFQRGFMGLFFAGNDIMMYVNPTPDEKKRGWIWMAIDIIHSKMAKSFLDATQTDETVFASFLQAEIDAWKSCFALLEERLDDTKIDPEDKTILN